MEITTARWLVTVSLVTFPFAKVAANNLADLLPNLLEEQTNVILAPPAGDFPSHEAHFVGDSEVLAGLAEGVNQSIISQLSTFPPAIIGEQIMPLITGVSADLEK